MSPDLSNLLDGDYDSEENPSFESDPAFEDDFNQLRQQSERNESTFGELEGIDDDFEEESRSGSRFSLSNFTPGQRLILVLLVLLDILAIGFGILVVMGTISL